MSISRETTAFGDRWFRLSGIPVPPSVVVFDYPVWLSRLRRTVQVQRVDWRINEQNRAAILSFITPARSRAVGATLPQDDLLTPSRRYPWGDAIVGQVVEGLFSETLRLTDFGVGSGEYDHSYVFNHTIQKNFRLMQELLQRVAP